MNQKKILFRADGNSIIGLGHLYRLFALVELYKEKNDFIFITKESSTLKVIPEDFSIETISNTIDIIEEPYILSTKYSPNEYIVIIDGYQFTPEYQKKLKSLGYVVIYIDDLIMNHQYADIVVNHSEGIESKKYITENYTELALGTKYAILRPSFLEAIKNKRIINTIDSVFVCFGGADMYDLSYKATKALLKFNKLKEIYVLLGGAYKHKQIFNLQKKHSNIHIYQNLQEKEIVLIMEKCNLAIAPASTTLYELCAIQMPILSGYFVDNQLNIYNSFTNKKAVYPGGDFSKYEEKNFFKAIQKILEITDYNSSLKIQQKLFDSKISNRFFELLNYVQISTRKASKDDMLYVYNWSNDPLVRKNSYDSNPITLENHEKWFESKMNDKNNIFYIIEFNSSPAGMVRYEVKEEYTVVGITIAKKYRGKKLAHLFLKKSAKEYFKVLKKPILAYIKKENIASVKSFEKSGYKPYKEELYNGINSFIYKLEKNDSIR
ncbi:UDP-2,4-diacetamido-2,4,6-trideoxy-beta-L-altropyranose hydrolase [Tenacibaculum halocynthiae]|uniref:UDP-2,4-diacetamido-2,4, 6-trideoxy-beta-L-altropyranose hydrolase n=1 Tax=Tenacibaculum halocynthiae TaxID=1254437 RepID=UPI003D652924